MKANSTYYPDTWVIICITNLENSDQHYRVFAEWYGGYAYGDSWKMNSGITKVTKDNIFYTFEGTSGSRYVCNSSSYRLRPYGYSILEGYRVRGTGKITIEVLDEQDWLEIWRLDE